MEKYNTKNTHANIRKEILAQEKPFCIEDLISRLEKKGITNKRLILYILDEMYKEGLVKHGKVSIEDSTDEIFAFYIE